ncbi:MAG: transcriptional repressor [Paracoccaceae bacterium]|nr:transcriptional repressor [Paracoccaceae bacterium]MDE2915148.1 transcriptional repressor [Paracoccaceae bacterium]
METDVQVRARDWLRKGGVRPTRQRLALAALLVGDGRNRHVTAEGLHRLAASRGAAVSKATVYNTLGLFCDAGLLNEIAVDGQTSSFDTCTTDHAHFFNERSGRLTDAPPNLVDVRVLAPPPDGTEIARVDVVVRLREI